MVIHACKFGDLTQTDEIDVKSKTRQVSKKWLFEMKACHWIKQILLQHGSKHKLEAGTSAAGADTASLLPCAALLAAAAGVDARSLLACGGIGGNWGRR